MSFKDDNLNNPKEYLLGTPPNITVVPAPNPEPTADEELADAIELKLLWLSHTLRDNEKASLEKCVLELIQVNNQRLTIQGAIAELGRLPLDGLVDYLNDRIAALKSELAKLEGELDG